MKQLALLYWLPGLVMPGFLCGQAQPEETVVHLYLNKSGSPTGPWETVDPYSLPRSGDGGVVDILEGPGAFYQLQLTATDQLGDALGLPLAQVPQEALAIAQAHLAGLRGLEPDWADAELGPLAIPVYSPAVGNGQVAAFYEFDVVALSPQPEPPDQPAFVQSEPVETDRERGYILVTVGRHDVPVPQYATSGKSRCQRLRYLSQDAGARMVRYSCDFWVAEDAKGRLLASMGSTPFQMPAQILEWAGEAPAVETVDNKTWQDDPRPQLQASAYLSYEAFKKDYVEGPVYAWLHKAKEKMAALDWAAFEDKPPPSIEVPVLDQTLILKDLDIRMFDLDTNMVTAWIEPKGGLWVTGSMDTIAQLTVIAEDGEVHYFIVVVGKPLQQLGWTSWTTYYGTLCAGLSRYTQVYDLSGCCNDAYSGCGPTAWAIFYGYWDFRGAPNLIGGTEDTPYYNDSTVEACTRRLFDLVNCWCTGISSQAATNPWDMSDGRAWAGERGESIDYSSRWCVPYTSSSPRNKAIEAIRYNRRPAIVGTGYFAHYPVANAYRYRRYRWGGITWDTQRQWRVYQGNGSSSCEWVDANICWFGMNARCY